MNSVPRALALLLVLALGLAGGYLLRGSPRTRTDLEVQAQPDPAALAAEERAEPAAPARSLASTGPVAPAQEPQPAGDPSRVPDSPDFTVEVTADQLTIDGAPFAELDLGGLGLEQAEALDAAIRDLELLEARRIRGELEREGLIDRYFVADDLEFYRQGRHLAEAPRVLHWDEDSGVRRVGSCEVDAARYPEAHQLFAARTALRERGALALELRRERDAWVAEKRADPATARVDLVGAVGAMAFDHEGRPWGFVNARLFGQY